jgi:hypothetical protein
MEAAQPGDRDAIRLLRQAAGDTGGYLRRWLACSAAGHWP